MWRHSRRFSCHCPHFPRRFSRHLPCFPRHFSHLWQKSLYRCSLVCRKWYDPSLRHY
ncbi:F-box-like domain-containing protein [Anaerotignum sp.]|uniref:F-box-like domain-containing protein n=1 Tax=Anaerotignum sp. TaxID=2039241 RepID=UPI003AB240FE